MAVLSACQNPVPEKPDLKSSTRGNREQHRHRFRGRHNLPPEPVNILTRGDTIFVPANSPVCNRLKIQTIDCSKHMGSFTTTGVVKPLTGHLAEVSTPFEGRIVKSFIRLGQKVKTGTPLFEVSSSEYLESVRLFLQASRERELAEKNYLRKKDLLEKGVSSSREFDEAKLEFDLADKEYEKSSAILKILNLDPEEADLTQPLIVRSPIPGEIVRMDITVGQYIRSDSDPIVTVAGLDRICVSACIREKDLGMISQKDQVEVFTESRPADPVSGEVSYIGNMMNEQTRSVEVYIECDNISRILKPGMFVTVGFSHEVDNAIIVPASSVMQDNTETFLFVQAGPGIYVKRKVSVTSVADSKVVVNSGLETGNIVVSEGGMYLQ